MRGGKKRRTANEFVQKAGMAEQKKSVTHVCIICDDATLQPKLPQLVLANEHTLRVQDIAELDNLPPNVHIKRRKSAWINVSGLVEYIRLLGDTLRAHAPDRQPFFNLGRFACAFARKSVTGSRSRRDIGRRYSGKNDMAATAPGH